MWGIEEEDLLTDIHACEVQWGKGPQMVGDKVKENVPMYVTAGDYVCTVVGMGNTVKKSMDKAYKIIKDKIEIPNSVMYRTDIGEKVCKNLPELQEHGYAVGVEIGE
jgi:phosphoribosylamine-glycine ligase